MRNVTRKRVYTFRTSEFPAAFLKSSTTSCRWCDPKSPHVFVLSFREQIVGTQTLSQCMYEGRIDLDGSTLTGTFKHRFFPCEHTHTHTHTHTHRPCAVPCLTPNPCFRRPTQEKGGEMAAAAAFATRFCGRQLGVALNRRRKACSDLGNCSRGARDSARRQLVMSTAIDIWVERTASALVVSAI